MPKLNALSMPHTREAEGRVEHYAASFAQPAPSTENNMNDDRANDHRSGACQSSDQDRSHRSRLTTAQEDLDATKGLDLATAGRSDMALAIERLRGALTEMIRCEREHHP